MALDKLLFVEMITNGIPVKEDIDLVSVFKKVEEYSETGGYKVIIMNEDLAVLDEQDNICTSLRLINSGKNDHRLVFFTPIDDSKILDVAKSVGAILFVTISACAQQWSSMICHHRHRRHRRRHRRLHLRRLRPTTQF